MSHTTQTHGRNIATTILKYFLSLHSLFIRSTKKTHCGDVKRIFQTSLRNNYFCVFKKYIDKVKVKEFIAKFAYKSESNMICE